MTLTNVISAPPIRHVISTGGGPFAAAPERPLYFAAAVAHSPLSLKAVILSEGAAESKDLRLPGAAFSQRSESQPPTLPQVNA
jgi:hypothetical protein